MKRYLVTGAAGFIGSHLIRKLITEECVVHALIAPQSNLWRLKDIENFLEIHPIDLTDFAGIQTLVETIRPHSVFHLASYGGMPFEQDQDQIYVVNFDGTRNLYNACKRVNVDCFIHTGSSSEYGCKKEPLSEGMLLEPISDYAVAKAATTQFLLKEAIVNRRAVYTVRPFSVYGPLELSTRMVPSVIQAACIQQPLAMSSPYYVRDYIYIDDMVDALLAVERMRPTAHFIFNAGTGVQSTIADVVKKVEMVVGTRLLVEWGAKEPRPWEPTSWVAQPDLASKVLDWRPTFSLQAGIEKTVKWFKNRKTWEEDGQALCALRSNDRLSTKNC